MAFASTNLVEACPSMQVYMPHGPWFKLPVLFSKGCSRFLPEVGVAGVFYMFEGMGVSIIVLSLGGECFYWDW